jgi:hypothetical protein
VELAREDEAKAAFEEALVGYEQAARDHPGDAAVQAGLAEALYRLSGFVGADAERKQERLARARRAVALRERLLAARPDDARLRLDLADALDSLHAALENMPGNDEWLPALQRAIDLWLEVASTDPDNPECLKALQRAFYDLGNHLSDPEQKAAMWRKSLAYGESAGQASL